MRSAGPAAVESLRRGETPLSRLQAWSREYSLGLPSRNSYTWLADRSYARGETEWAHQAGATRMNWDEFLCRVRRGETPFYARLNRAGKTLLNIEGPYIPGLHRFLYRERQFRIDAWREFWRAFYYQPLFRSQCVRCGKRLRIHHSGQGLPFIAGNVAISVGDNVKIRDRTTIIGLTAGNRPSLTIGDNTDIATPISIFIGREVSIGSNCLAS